MLRAATSRLALVHDARAQRQLLQLVQLPLLHAFTREMRRRADASIHVSRRPVGEWGEIGALLRALSFCAALLAEWQE